MSYNSLLLNRQNMGHGAITGLFLESPAQPKYSYRRNNQRLRDRQQSNSEDISPHEQLLKYITTTWHSLQHLCIYRLTPQFHMLVAKCKTIAKHMDAASLCVIIFAIFVLFIVVLSRFIVDYEDIHSNSIPIVIDPIHDITKLDDSLVNDTSAPTYDVPPIYHEQVVEEYDTIDNLFKPTPIPIIEEEQDMLQDEDESILRSTSFNQWVLIDSVNWNDIKIGQIIKVKSLKNNKVSTAIVNKIDLFKMNVGIQHENCWVLCHETIDIIASQRMIYLIHSQIRIHEDSDHVTNGNNNNHYNDEHNNDNMDESIHDIDPTSFHESVDKIHEDHNEFKEWVHSQFTDIQQSNEEFKDVLTDYLDDKMTQMLQMLQAQQNVIQSIQTHQQQSYQAVNGNESISQQPQLDWDWDSIEDRMDNKIENVVKEQLQEKFGTLAQEIGQEIAKEIAAQQTIPNHPQHGDIIKGNNDFNDVFDDTNSENVGRKKQSNIDWSYSVISHSALKTSNDLFYGYGHWIMHNILAKWNQQSISSTTKPGDCTPLEFDREQTPSNAYITIELYQPIHVTQISLYHYHSAVLTQDAINAAPKDFQIWGSYNMSKWYDLGNFSYDYFDEKYTQYFDVVDSEKKENDNDVEEDEEDEVWLEEDIESDTDIVKTHTNDTMNADMDEDYKRGFKYIVFRLLSNYGGSDYGCIYRLRIFGDAVKAS